MLTSCEIEGRKINIEDKERSCCVLREKTLYYCKFYNSFTQSLAPSDTLTLNKLL